MKKILITGTTGFLGKHIWHELSSSSQYDLIAGARKNLSAWKNWLYLDLENTDSLPDKKVKVDIVINCAASICGSDEKIFQVNCKGFHKLINWAQDNGCRQFIHLSSIGVIGNPSTLPVDETHPVHPQSFYHLSKLYGEKLLLLPRYRDLRPVILRIPSPLGQGMNNKTIVPFFLSRAMQNKSLPVLGSGNRIQNYIDARDIACAVKLSVEKEISGLFNLGATSLSNLEVAKACIEFCQAGRIEFCGMEDREENLKWLINSAKFFNEVNFRPMYSFRDSLKYLAANSEF